MNPLQRFFQEDIPATFSAGKWRIDLLQYKSRLSQLEKQKMIMLAELGKKAWASRVSNDSYASVYGKLEELDGLVGRAQEETEIAQNKINLETNHLNTTNAGFETRLKETQGRRQVALEKLAKLQTVQKNIEQRASQLQAAVNQSSTNLQNLAAQINQLQASEQVDKEAKIASIKETGAAVQMQKNEALAKITAVKEEFGTNQAEQNPVKQEIEGFNQQIAALQEQKKQAVQPIQEQLKLIHQDLLKANEKKTGLLNQITALMPEFGGQVYRYRPSSIALTAEYGKVDAIQKDIKATSDQINLTQARLSSVNSGSLLKVALTAGVLIFLFVCLIVAVKWVIPAVAKLLTPDPKSSIKLVQNWTLENCTPTGSSDGLYYDISVWENRRNNAVAHVDTEVKLSGSNDVVLDSQLDEMEIAPGEMMVSMIQLNSKGSRVQDINRSVTSVYFSDTLIKNPNKLDVQMYFEPAKSINNVSLALEITNKSDFGISGYGMAYAFVVNKQNKVIDILEGGLETGTIKIDSMSKVMFQTVNYNNSSSCLQSDYTQEEVTFWYFVPLQISTDSGPQFMVSGKAAYKP
jgi:hypothetical protein